MGPVMGLQSTEFDETQNKGHYADQGSPILVSKAYMRLPISD